jgi:selenocysteine lyase/cysteine desulfurase
MEALKKKTTPWAGMGSDADVNAVRTLFAELISAESADCIALCHSTSLAISMAAKNLLDMGILGPKANIILLENEMASAVLPWQDACQKSGARLRIISDPLRSQSESSWADAVIAAIDESVVVLQLPNVHWCDGSLIDLTKISAYLETLPKHRRPLLIIDGTQSIGAMEFSVAILKPTFVACSVHKWLCSPYGCSLVYLDPEYHNIWNPIDHHERSREGSDRAEWDEEGAMNNDDSSDASLHAGYPTTFMPGARRLDAGGRPNPVTIPMIREALACILRWRPSCIQRYLTTLTDHIVDEIKGKHLPVIVKDKCNRSGHILGVRLQPHVLDHLRKKGASVGTLGTMLKQRKVVVSVRSGCLRVAPYLYNCKDEATRFVETLGNIIDILLADVNLST